MPTFDDALRSIDDRFARLRDEKRIPGHRLGRDPRRRAGPRRRLGDDPRRRGPGAGRRHGVPDRVDDQVLHRRDDPAAARRGPAPPGRPGGDARAGAGRLGAAHERQRADHDPPAAHDVGRPGHGRSLGRSPAGPAARPVRGAAGRRAHVRVAAGDRRSTTPTWATGSWAASSRTSRAPSTARWCGTACSCRWAWPPPPISRRRSRRSAWPTATSAAARRWSARGRDPYGALASMGGVFSSVRDLARWVGGFLDAFPARSDPEGPHPLRRASRREMQQVQRAFGTEVRAACPGRGAGRARRRLRLRAVHRHRPGSGHVREPFGRVPGLRVQHGLAPGDRPGGDRPGEPPLRAGRWRGRRGAGRPGPGGSRARGGRCARRPSWSGSATWPRACSRAGTTPSRTRRSR